jgi:methyltransferase-like protein
VFVLSGGDSVRALQLANQIEDYMNMQLPWLLDFILHKCFREILVAVKNVLEERRKNYNHAKCTLNENIDGMLVPKISMKRKYGELEGFEKSNSSENVSFSYEKLSRTSTIHNSASIKITMRSVSKCNVCSDWLIHTDETISNFNYHSHFQTYWRKYSEKTVQNEFKIDSKPVQLQTVLESDNEPPNIKMNEKPCDFSIKVKWMYNTGKCVDASPLISSLR